MHYGRVTVYTDMGTKMWRLKPKKGSTQLLHYSWKIVKPKDAWTELVKDAKRLAR